MRNSLAWLRRRLFATFAIALVTCAAWSFGQTPFSSTALAQIEIVPGAKKNAATKQVEKAEPASDDTWQVIHLGDSRIGYARSSISKGERDGKQILKTASETQMTLKRFGQTLTMQTLLETEETLAGDMLSFTFEMRNPPNSVMRTEGKVVGQFLELNSTTAGIARKSNLSWDPTVKSPAYQERMFRDKPLKPGQSVTFKAFLPELGRIADITVAANEYGFEKLLEGEPQKLLKATVTQSVFPNMPIEAYLDEQGQTLKTATEFSGQKMLTYAVSREEALKTIAGGELDIAVGTMVAVSPIPRGHKTKQVVYRIAIKDEDPAKYLVDGGTQKVKRIEREKDVLAELTVTALPQPKTASKKKVDPEYLAATTFLQSDDTNVKTHARNAASGLTDPTVIAYRMEKYVHEKLEAKNFSTALASAAEVAKHLAGDCTEHAVLLAAMLRAAKIPSRIAVGMVYVPRTSQFGGHMWTEAFLGDQWVPLDATLGQGGIGAAHIKLVDSSFADDAPAPVTLFLPLLKVLGKMEIEVISSE